MRRPSLKGVGNLFANRKRTSSQSASEGKRSVRLALGSLIAVAIICIGYVGLWFYLAMQTRDDVIAWFQKEVMGGRTAAYTRLEISGFPFELRVTLDNAQWGEHGSAAAWNLKAAQLAVHLAPWSPGRFIIEPRGAQEVEFTSEGRTERFTGTAGLLHLDLSFDGESYPSEVAIVGESVAFNRERDGAALKVGSVKLVAALLEPQQKGPEAISGRMNITASGVHLPADIGLPLGSSIHTLSVDSRLMGVFLVPASPGTLSSWRDDGGTLEVDRISLSYGPLSVSASGTVALDGKLQPIAAFTGRFQGFFQTIDALRDRGLIRSKEATMSKLVLGSMARKSETGGPLVISLPITIQDRTVYAGPVPLARLNPVPWSALFPAAPIESPSPAAPEGGEQPPPQSDTRT